MVKQILKNKLCLLSYSVDFLNCCSRLTRKIYKFAQFTAYR